jgi:hypothetical protein
MRDLYDAIAGPLRAHEPVIVILGDWLPEESLRSVRTVHSLLQTDRVAVHVTSLPPLAASVQAALAAALAPLSPSAGALAGALETVGGELYLMAWTGSVAGLQHPSVSLLHHARSLLPRAAFGVGLQPEAFVQSASREPTVPLEPVGHPLELLVAPTESAELSWVLDVVAPALGGVAVRELAPTMHGPAWWGSSRLVEVVGVPSSLHWLADAVFTDPPVPCSWCGEPILATPCPFCGVAAPMSANRLQQGKAGSVAPAGDRGP